MELLIQNITLAAPGNAHSGKTVDILISNGIIKKISNGGSLNLKSSNIFNGTGLFVSPGWFDLHVRFREPGEEHKEDIHSGIEAACQGGWTGVLCMPSTVPPVQSKAEVEFIINRAAGQLVDVIPSGTISRAMQGKDLSEMYDMFRAGARAFTDDKNPIMDSGLMIRALLYSLNSGGRIFSFPNDTTVSGKGQMHEGVTSTFNGLKGIPDVAEEIMIQRDLSLVGYTNAPVHFSTVSSKSAVELIRNAKKKGLKVSADVSAVHLFLDDSALSEFDTNLKVNPPLRTPEDRKALIEGLMDGTIDAVTSDHSPENPENKVKEFDLASFGMESLETTFGTFVSSMGKNIDPEFIAAKFSDGPRRILGFDPIVIAEGEHANLTLYDKEREWIVERKHIRSRSLNNPFIGRTLRGMAVAVFNNGQFHRCE